MGFLQGYGGCCGCAGRPAPCDVPAAPTLKCDTISAVLNKCGEAEFGTPSSPPKFYLTKTQQGTRLASTNPGTITELTRTTVFSGSLAYARPACTTTETRQSVISEKDGSATGTGCAGCGTVSSTNNAASGWGLADEFHGGGSGGPGGCTIHAIQCNVGCSINNISESDYCCSDATVVGPTLETFYGVCGSYGTESSDVLIQLADEYTTALLKTDTIAALPSYPGTFVGTCSAGAFGWLTADQFTYSLQRFKFKFNLPTLTGYSAYYIHWQIQLYFAGSGVTVYLSSGTYIWDGVATSTPILGEVFEQDTYGYPQATYGTGRATVAFTVSCS